MEEAGKDVNKELQEKLTRLLEEREARYKEEDEKREQERLEADKRAEEERERDDRRREEQRREEAERIEQERAEESERRERERQEQEESRQEEDRRFEERLEQERQEEDRRGQEQRRREEIELKLELARDAREQKERAELARKEEAHKTIRDIKQIDRELKRRNEGYSQSPGERLFGKKGREQRLHESRGRETEWHIRYQNSMSRKALEEKLMRHPDLKQSIEADIAKIKEIEKKQLEGEKIQSVDLKRLEVNANRYLFGGVVEKEAENKQKDKDPGEEKQNDSKPPISSNEKDKEPEGEDKNLTEPISNRLPASDLQELKQQVERENETAKNIEFLVAEDGTKINKESSLENLHEYSEELTQKIRSNWYEGRGYVFEEEVKLTAVDGWIEGGELEDYRHSGSMNLLIDKLPEATSDEQQKVQLDIVDQLKERSEEIYHHGFEDSKGRRFNMDSDPERLDAKAAYIESIEFDHLRVYSDEEYRKEFIEANAQNMAIRDWIERVPDRNNVVDMTAHRLDALEEALSSMEQVDDSTYEEMIADIEVVQNSIMERAKALKDVPIEDKVKLEKYQEAIKEHEEIDLDKRIEAGERGRELREITLEDGTVVTPESSSEDLQKGFDETFSKLHKMRLSGDRSEHFYQMTADNSAVSEWGTLRTLEDEAREKGSIQLLGVEYDVEDGRLFDEGEQIDIKLERLNDAKEHIIDFEMRPGYKETSKEEHAESLKEDLKMIFEGRLNKPRTKDWYSVEFEEYEPLKGLDDENELEKGLEAYKDEHSEKLIPRDELDQLFNLPEDERDVSREQEVIDRGDSGDKGDLGLEPEIEATERDFTQAQPEVEVSQPEVSKDEGIVDNIDGFKGREDDGPQRDDDGLSR